MDNAPFCELGLRLIDEFSAAAIRMRDERTQAAMNAALSARSVVKRHVEDCPICSVVRDAEIMIFKPPPLPYP
nr:hypothetical protein [uncultured bacterium]